MFVIEQLYNSAIVTTPCCDLIYERPSTHITGNCCMLQLGWNIFRYLMVDVNVFSAAQL